MNYDVDENYEFETDEYGFPYFPDDMTTDGDLYILPNGKYLPRGAYLKKDGTTIIYEPSELSFFSQMLANIEGDE